MRTLTATLVVLALAARAFAGDVVVTPEKDVQWKPVPGMPEGIVGALMSGDPKTGPTISLVKIPAGTVVAPHSHPGDETGTLVSGTAWLGQGEMIGKAASLVEPGAYFVIPAGAPHWFRAETDCVLVRYSNGPSEMNYCDPKDDPRGKK